jgi:hypothetical protein
MPHRTRRPCSRATSAGVKIPGGCLTAQSGHLSKAIANSSFDILWTVPVMSAATSPLDDAPPIPDATAIGWRTGRYGAGRGVNRKRCVPLSSRLFMDSNSAAAAGTSLAIRSARNQRYRVRGRSEQEARAHFESRWRLTGVRRVGGARVSSHRPPADPRCDRCGAVRTRISYRHIGCAENTVVSSIPLRAETLPGADRAMVWPLPFDRRAAPTHPVRAKDRQRAKKHRAPSNSLGASTCPEPNHGHRASSGAPEQPSSMLRHRYVFTATGGVLS